MTDAAEDRELAAATRSGGCRGSVASEKRGRLEAKVAPATYAQMRYVPALIITGPMARPSRPSVRFTAFEVATTTNTANGT